MSYFYRRLIEILTNNWTLSELLRAPCTTKNQVLHIVIPCSNTDWFIQKLHNVEVALKHLSEHICIPFGINTQSITDGHRDKTLTLLWTIIFHFKVCFGDLV